MNLPSKYKEEASKLQKQNYVLEQRYSNNQTHISNLNQKIDKLEQDKKSLTKKARELTSLIEKLDQINLIELRESYINKFEQIVDEKRQLNISIESAQDEINELKLEQSRVTKVIEIKSNEKRKILNRGGY